MTRRVAPLPLGDGPDTAAARMMGVPAGRFRKLLPELHRRGFPMPDFTTGLFDLDAIADWRRSRHPGLYEITLPRNRSSATVPPSSGRGSRRSVGSVKIPYYVVNGKGYWQPTSAMRARGFVSRRLGDDGPEAWRQAQTETERWHRVSRGEEEQTPAENATPETIEVAIRYPRGSVGEAWQRFIRTDEWKAKALGTRTKIWWPAWTRRIRPVFGACDPNTLTMADISEWRTLIVKRDGVDAAHKAMKVWRAFWKVLQGLHYTARPDPSLSIRNKGPRPRTERWREGEAVRMVKAAWRSGYKGLACIIAVTWDSAFQPGDTRTLRVRHLGLTRDGLMIFDRRDDGREKTGVAALGTVSARTAWLVAEYVGDRGVELLDDAFLFANRIGRPYRIDTLADDFARIRTMLWPGDKRQLRDMRRSGATEAVVGIVDPGALAAKLANSIQASDRLWKTYVKVDEVAVRAADQARLRGRAKIRAMGDGKPEVVDLDRVRRRYGKQ